MGSNMAEQHPVGFQWVIEAKERGAKAIHVDPRFTRTSAMADLHVPLRPGTDIAFLDGIVNHVLTHDRYFHEYVVAYTPAVGEEICGVPQDVFLRVCALVEDNSGRDRTTAFAYAVGWTQHTVGVQYIRTAAILQLLLGNIGRSGGGIMALRGHASIQGSTDIPTLFNILPGYIPMPHAGQDTDLESYIAADAGTKGYWGNMDAYAVSLLKSWFGDAATAANDYCFDYLPRLTSGHSNYDTVVKQVEGQSEGYFVVGENPAVGTANAKMNRVGLAGL